MHRGNEGKHTSIDSNARIVFDIQINMFLNTKPKVPGVAEIAPLQLVFLNLETPLENLFGLHHNQ